MSIEGEKNDSIEDFIPLDELSFKTTNPDDQKDDFDVELDRLAEEAGPGGYQAIDFHHAGEQIDLAMNYIDSTRSDFEFNDEIKQQILDVEYILDNTQKKLREFDATHYENTVIRTDSEGVRHEVLLRFQDPRGFDEVVKMYDKAMKQYHTYYIAHAKLVLAEVEKEEQEEEPLEDLLKRAAID